MEKTNFINTKTDFQNGEYILFSNRWKTEAEQINRETDRQVKILPTLTISVSRSRIFFSFSLRSCLRVATFVDVSVVLSLPTNPEPWDSNSKIWL